MGEDELSASSCAPFIPEEKATDSHGIQSMMTALEMHCTCILGEHLLTGTIRCSEICEVDPVSMQTRAN